MKRFFIFLLAAALVFSCTCFAGCGGPRDELLRIYIPGEYMDPDVYDGFAEWYEDKTGKKITVKETTFESNESMLLKIKRSKKDYDLVCPSDYMLERMREEKLLKPLNKEIIDVRSLDEDGNQLIKQTYLNVARTFDPELEYTVPFMYGTFGIMYDYSRTGQHIDSWEYMFFEDEPARGNAFRNKFTQKESVREMYASTCIYARRAELSRLSKSFTDYGKEYQDYLQSIYEDTQSETINTVKRLLTNQKKYILKYEVDDGKFGIAGGTLPAYGGLYWSCDVGFVMSDYEDDSGEEFEGNKNLWYYIPKEGGNVYIDAFAIPKYAANEYAANMFLKYLCLKDVAIQNSEYIGAISPVSAAYDELYEQYSTDDEFFEGTAEATDDWWSWKDMYLDMFFPSEETLKRCGVLRNFKTNNSMINRMFADIVG